jgi:hypothetical protein
LASFGKDRHAAALGDKPAHLVKENIADTLEDRGFLPQQQLIGDLARTLLEIAVLSVPAVVAGIIARAEARGLDQRSQFVRRNGAVLSQQDHCLVEVAVPAIVGRNQDVNRYISQPGEPSPSAAHTRWQVMAAPSMALEANAPGRPAFDLTLLRHRGGRDGLHIIMEWDRDTGSFRERGEHIVTAPLSRASSAMVGGGAGDTQQSRAA